MVIDQIRYLICCIHLETDIDECIVDGANKCHSEAVCMNTDGSYDCLCVTGFTGIGVFCTG